MATSKKSSKRSPSSKRKRQPTKAPARSRKTPAPPKPAPAKPPTRSYLEDAPVEIPKPTKVILIVDDHKDMQESIQTLLELSVPNVRILTASTAEEGLEVLGRESVQLIVSDYRMPGMDGVSFLKKARAMVPNVARVLLTAHPRMAVAMPEVEQAGIHQVLVKPMPSDALVRSVQEIFRRKGHDDLVPVAMKQLVEQAENPAH